MVQAHTYLIAQGHQVVCGDEKLQHHDPTGVLRAVCDHVQDGGHRALGVARQLDQVWGIKEEDRELKERGEGERGGEGRGGEGRGGEGREVYVCVRVCVCVCV